MTDVVILVPGIMGSELKADGALVWPGNPWEVLTPYNKLEKLLEPDLEVGDIIRWVVVKGVYGPLIDALGRCGFSEKEANPNLVVCPYDWRKDNAESAARLAERVRYLRQLHGPDLKIDILAHSMGGLVARHFLESGRFGEVNCCGFDNIRSLTTMGTPHRGAPLALAAALGGVRKLFLSATQVQALASNEAFPALYQLLPPEDEPFLWNLASSARLAAVDIYDPRVHQTLGLSDANLESARTFRASLDIRSKPKSVSYFCFVGTKMDTYGHMRVDMTVSKPIPQAVSVSGGGDGTVPMWSATLGGVQQLAVGGEHGTIFNDSGLLLALGSLLGKPGSLAGVEGDFKVSLGNEVVEPNFKLQVVLTSTQLFDQLDAEIMLIKLTDEHGQEMKPPQQMPNPHPVHYKGAWLDGLSLRIVAPIYAGAYSVEMRSNGKVISQSQPVFLVQDSLTA
ncbi:alpha/beta fold hydrolase [Paraburkholderia rhynchosiae]|uniref:Lecithin:cholesterol acyltransferase n=1 Tax=Paraburkholderia rhynchosiae TaxID=487049 RepID=A0A2N7WWD0_9BURK|nr:alpha/beta hydrolase [Paraburkholderia rhynchosiae]PMS33769.1 hypothetical protein C0Z16_04360 [Paraburkholderia rhynchosiae]CAB3669158.1 hypothetical protein LMG27174_02058 [Paraburkholderia rhynchosiae]